MGIVLREIQLSMYAVECPLEAIDILLITKENFKIRACQRSLNRVLIRSSTKKVLCVRGLSSKFVNFYCCNISLTVSHVAIYTIKTMQYYCSTSFYF